MQLHQNVWLDHGCILSSVCGGKNIGAPVVKDSPSLCDCSSHSSKIPLKKSLKARMHWQHTCLQWLNKVLEVQKALSLSWLHQHKCKVCINRASQVWFSDSCTFIARFPRFWAPSGSNLEIEDFCFGLEQKLSKPFILTCAFQLDLSPQHFLNECRTLHAVSLT